MTRRKSIRRAPHAQFPWVTSWIAVCLVAQLCHLPTLQAQSEPAATQQRTAPREAHLIEVPLPITGMVDTKIKRKIDLLLSQQGTSENRPILILEVAGGDEQASQRSEFERCLSLARYLASDKLGGTRTVAYVAGNLKGHALLPVLACEELIVNPDAEIGDAGRLIELDQSANQRGDSGPELFGELSDG